MGFAVVDVETTGLNPRVDRIVEVGIVTLDRSGEPVGQWSSLVEPGRPIGATFVHGITDGDVAQAPTFADVLPDLVPLLRGRALVAHNARFDLAFLNAAFSQAGYPMRIPAEASTCTMELSKIYLPPGRHGLTAAIRRAGLRLGEHHRALADARGAADLFRVYLKAEREGKRYAHRAVSRQGHETLPGSWRQAQAAAACLVWPEIAESRFLF